jgi:putative DNA primase/helicase
MSTIDLRSLARALSGEVAGNQVLAPGPGHTPKDRSLAVRPCHSTADGFLVHSHAGDDWRECLDHVRSRLGLPEWQPGDGQDRTIHAAKIEAFDRKAVDHQVECRHRTEDDLVRIARAVRIWNEACDPRRTLAEHYLASRKLELTADLAGNVLRFHPRCPWRNENTGNTDRIPALIAAFRSIDDDKITAIHRIAFNDDGTKIGRRMFGVVRRAAVKLSRVQSGDELTVGEGVETCMAAQQLGLWPAWALGSVGAISFLPLIPSIRRLTILAETGAPSRRAIKICSARWRDAGCQVSIVTPAIGSDLNDELMAAS